MKTEVYNEVKNGGMPHYILHAQFHLLDMNSDQLPNFEKGVVPTNMKKTPTKSKNGSAKKVAKIKNSQETPIRKVTDTELKRQVEEGSNDKKEQKETGKEEREEEKSK